ncbi:MAG: amino acid ABC transporter permease [Betaproteobacteria bacterium]|nr:amino acid ABC transporter permease [Betaproteobacteria bacterium]
MDRFVSSFFNTEVAARYLEPMLDGMLLTVGLGLCVIATGLVMGLMLAVVRIQHVKLVNVFIVAFADIFRALPPLVVIILLFFAFPYIELSMSAFTATWLALSLVLSAFTEEIFWAGMLAIPKGQWEAARSTGLGRWATLVHVILPQAVRMTVPPLTNRTIAITKGTALGSVVALHEVLNVSSAASSEAGNATPLVMGALAYLILFIPFVVLGRWVETRFTWKR